MSLRDLASDLAGGPSSDVVRVGTVSAVTSRNDGGATYVLVTIDGRPMRCLSTYSSPTVGHTVIWLRTDKQAVCLGPML